MPTEADAICQRGFVPGISRAQWTGVVPATKASITFRPTLLKMTKTPSKTLQDWSPVLSGEGAPRKASFPAPFALAPNAKVLHGRRGLEGTDLGASVNAQAQGWCAWSR